MNFTQQELFDKAWHAIHKQGVPSISSHDDVAGTQCLYRGPNGTSCAFGHLVPEELRFLLIENKTADEQFNIPEISDYFGVSPGALRLFFLHLQAAHDNAASQATRLTTSFMDLYRENMHEVAKMYGLTVPGDSDA